MAPPHPLLQVIAHGVPLVRLRPDPAILSPNPRYFQTIQGLMNISGPAVGAYLPGHGGLRVPCPSQEPAAAAGSAQAVLAAHAAAPRKASSPAEPFRTRPTPARLCCLPTSPPPDRRGPHRPPRHPRPAHFHRLPTLLRR